MKRAKQILIWVIGVMFIITGALKLLNMDSMSADIFTKANFPSWLYYLTGLTEVAGGVLILLPKFRVYGAALIATIMLGAIGTHIYVKDDLVHIIVPLLLVLFTGSLVMKFKE